MLVIHHAMTCVLDLQAFPLNFAALLLASSPHSYGIQIPKKKNLGVK